MREVFDFAVSFWDVTENALANWIILGLMAPIPYVLAYKVTGRVSFFVSYNSLLMRMIHWPMRFVIYVFFVDTLKAMIWIISLPLKLFNINNPRFISAIVVIIFLLVFAGFVKFKSNLNNKPFWS